MRLRLRPWRVDGSGESICRVSGTAHASAIFLRGEGVAAIKAAIRDILETALLTLVIFLSVRLGVQNFRVEGFSMEPTMHTNQYLLVNKVSYMVGDPHRGDIVVLRFPQDPRRDFIKRVIALPGEEVEVKGGAVYIDGKPLAEPYIHDKPAYTYPKKRVPENDFYVLGDNRNNSHDSHVWDWLPREYLIGKAWVSYWPVAEWSVVRHDSAGYATAWHAFLPAA